MNEAQEPVPYSRALTVDLDAMDLVHRVADGGRGRLLTSTCVGGF